MGSRLNARMRKEKLRDSVLPGWALAAYLQVGAEVYTDYDFYRLGGKILKVRIVERKEGDSKSGVMFRVHPSLPRNGDDAWFDASWFSGIQPVVEASERHYS